MDDTEFENFWFTLKRNMLNYYNDEKKINEWSKILNALKERREYQEIQIQILQYLCEMATDLVYNFNSRIADIFFVNLKRWYKIISKNNFLGKYTFYKYIEKFNKLKSIVGLTIKLNELLDNKTVKEYYVDIEYRVSDIIRRELPPFEIDRVLTLAVNSETASMLEYLYNLYDMDNYILETYGLNVMNLKLTKVLYQLKNKIEV
jgi:hypothetical protein